MSEKPNDSTSYMAEDLFDPASYASKVNPVHMMNTHKQFRNNKQATSDAIKEYVESQLTKNQWKIDVVLSHTLPYEYMPTDLFLSGIDQSKVDNSTEHWLSDIESKLDYKWWYAGHYHTSRITDNIQIMFEDIEEFGIHGQLQDRR